MRDYGKVHTSFWTSANIRALSEDGRSLAFYLLTCPHGTIAGVFRLPDGYICDDMQWGSERVNTTLAELFANGFATRCEVTKWVWVIKHLEWNPPENPNQKKAAAKMADQVPNSCVWKDDFIGECGVFMGIEVPIKQEPLPNPSETLSQPVTVTVTVTETVSSLSPAKLPTCPTKDLIDLYHQTLPELPVVKLLNDGRKKALATFWKWVLTSTRTDGQPRATTHAEAMEWVESYFKRARENNFLMGRISQVGAHAGWVCDLDFLLTEKGKKQVIEKTKEAA